MTKSRVEVKVLVSRNGPYLVSGDIPLARQTIGSDAQGESQTWEEGDAYPRRASLRAVPLRPLQDQAVLRRHAHQGGF